MRAAIDYLCASCGSPVPAAERYPFRCPNHGSADDVEHVLCRRLEPQALPSLDELEKAFSSPETNPFIKYRALLWSYQSALVRGLDDSRFVELVARVNDDLEGVEGRGFRVTPFEPAEGLARELEVAGLWVKDETGNVAGSHKARHLMGLMLCLEVERLLGGTAEPRPLAIASCGNAALAAAVVARASHRELEVFIPEHADAKVVNQLTRHGARLTRCRREPGSPGDPSVARFREALAAGALPFTCQGPENGLVIEGGETLAFEMLSTLMAREQRLDRVVVQVGGGALTTAVSRGFEEAALMGLIEWLPRVCTVQTEGAAPLARAYELVASRIVEASADSRSCPSEAGARADWLRHPDRRAQLEEALSFAAHHRSRFMWPWEQEPRSIATGILDDETYDWLAVVRAMLVTGGVPLVVSEEQVRAANDLAHRETEIAVDPTGSAGLAGCLALREQRALGPDEQIAVLFTGVRR